MEPKVTHSRIRLNRDKQLQLEAILGSPIDDLKPGWIYLCEHTCSHTGRNYVVVYQEPYGTCPVCEWKWQAEFDRDFIKSLPREKRPPEMPLVTDGG